MLNPRLRQNPLGPLAIGFRLLVCVVVLFNVAALGSCKKKYTAVALTSTGHLIQFRTNKPGSISSDVTLSGSTSGDSVVQIAYRPATPVGQPSLYCVTSNNELCTINPASGLVTAVGAPFLADRLSNVAASFDPVNDQLRVTAFDSASSTGRVNFRVSPTGALVTVGATKTLDYDSSSVNGTPQINGITYNNPNAGAPDTTLYGLDVNTESLVRIGDSDVADPRIADAGSVHVIGPLNLNFSANLGFSIAPQDGTAYAVLAAVGSGAQLYTIDLGSGTPTLVGTVHNSDYTLVSLAIVP